LVAYVLTVTILKSSKRTSLLARNPYRATAIVSRAGACDAVKAIAGKRFLDVDTEGVFVVKRHAKIYTDPQDSQTDFKYYNACSGYQRSDSGMWYASHDDTHNFFSAAHPEKLRGINWDTMEIADDVNPLDKAIIVWSCMDAGCKSIRVMTTAGPPKAQLQGR
jgi:hypothetical protein